MSLCDQVRVQKRKINHEVNRISRQLHQLRTNDKKLSRQLKYYEQHNDKAASDRCLQLLVQCKIQIRAVHNILMHCQSVTNKLDQAQTSVQLQSIVQDVVKVMNGASRRLSLTRVSQNAAAYMRNVNENELKLEVVGDAVGEDFEDEDLRHEIMQEIRDELQIDLRTSLPSAPTTNVTIAESLARRKQSALAGAVPVLETTNDKNDKNDKPKVLRWHSPTVETIHGKPHERAQATTPKVGATAVTKAQATTRVQTNAAVYDGVASALQKRLEQLGKFPRHKIGSVYKHNKTMFW